MSAYQPLVPSDQQASGQQTSAPSPDIQFEPAQLRPRRDGWTAEKQIRFIEALAATKCVDEACRRVGMSDSSAYSLRLRPCGAAFRRAWDAALDCHMHRLEQAVLERSINGVARPIFYKGEQVGEWRHYDERMAMFLLRSRRAHRYGKWQDAMPAPDPEEFEDDGITLDGSLTEIECTAPETGGNPVEAREDGVADEEVG